MSHKPSEIKLPAVFSLNLFYTTTLKLFFSFHRSVRVKRESQACNDDAFDLWKMKFWNYLHWSMWHVHVETVENDFGIFVLAIIFIATANFNRVHVAWRNCDGKLETVWLVPFGSTNFMLKLFLFNWSLFSGHLSLFLSISFPRFFCKNFIAGNTVTKNLVHAKNE